MLAKVPIGAWLGDIWGMLTARLAALTTLLRYFPDLQAGLDNLLWLRPVNVRILPCRESQYSSHSKNESRLLFKDYFAMAFVCLSHRLKRLVSKD